MAATSNVCGVIDVLADFQQQVISAINGKFASLRRLSELLQQLADLTGFIPDISKLIPISAIDLTAYENLRNSCKFLNLPPSSGDPEQTLGALRAQVNTAYGRLLGQLNLNPLGRMDKLQGKLNDYQARFNLGTLGGVDFMQCLQAACQAVVAVEGSVSNLSNTSSAQVKKAAQDYLDNIVNGNGKVLSAEAQAKVGNWSSTKSGVVDLMDVPAIDLPTL